MPKKKGGGGGGGANWMDTYGDMVTLLLCFFVLLYSMSTISEDKWKALVQSFNPNAIPAATEIEGGNDGPSADSPGESGIMEDPASDDITQQDVQDMMEQLAAALSEWAADNANVSVSEEGGLIYVTLSDSAMFKPDKKDFLPGAEDILADVCVMLDNARDAIDEIRVEGHTAQGSPDRPNRTRGDRELASGRATEVTIYIQEHSTIFPGRLYSVGVGQWHPVGDNKDEAGRAPNRRVELVISARDLEQEAALQDSLSHYTTSTSADIGGGDSAPADGGQAQAPAPAENQDQ